MEVLQSRTSRVRQLEQLTMGTVGALAQTISVIRLRESRGFTSGHGVKGKIKNGKDSRRTDIALLANVSLGASARR